MAIVRWGTVESHGYDSDVYIYRHIDGRVVCCGCILVGVENHEDGQGFFASRESALVPHVEAHIGAGHAVPDWVIPVLEGERESYPDLVLIELIATCKAQNAVVATFDIDVPQQYRASMAEVKEASVMHVHESVADEVAKGLTGKA